MPSMVSGALGGASRHSGRRGSGGGGHRAAGGARARRALLLPAARRGFQTREVPRGSAGHRTAGDVPRREQGTGGGTGRAPGLLGGVRSSGGRPSASRARCALVCLLQGPGGGAVAPGGPEQLVTRPPGAPRALSPAPPPEASRTTSRGCAAASQPPFYSLPARPGPRASSPPPPARRGAPVVLPLPAAPPAPRAAPAPLHLITRLSRLLSCS